MNRVNTLLGITAKPRILIILIMVTIIDFALIGVLAAQISTVSGGETLLDFSFGHTLGSVTTTLNNYGEEGITLYHWVQRIDLIHPLIYSLLFASFFFQLFQQTRFSFLVYLPLAMGLLDYLENICLFFIVSSFPDINTAVVQAASLFSFAKNGVQYMTIAAFLGGIASFLIQKFKE